jgi:hypothetical protein
LSCQVEVVLAVAESGTVEGEGYLACGANSVDVPAELDHHQGLVRVGAARGEGGDEQAQVAGRNLPALEESETPPPFESGVSRGCCKRSAAAGLWSAERSARLDPSATARR